MKYLRDEARSYAQRHLSGVWAAVPTPFDANLQVDEAGFLRNVAHWVEELEIDGLFVAGKQGEFFSMSVPERKRLVAAAVDGVKGLRRPAQIIVSCSDQNLDVVLELASHAETIGADYLVVHSPMLHFATDIESTVYEYYRYIAARTNLGIAMWSHPDAGYLMSPELCVRIAADCPNVVAVKYSVPRDMYVRLSRMTQGQLIVSTSSEAEWLDNIVELGWRLYLCSTPPLLYQTRADRCIRRYTDLAFGGDFAAARKLSDSLAPVRDALRGSRPPGTPHAQQKYWQELLGQVGGPVRRPLLNLTTLEKQVIEQAFAASGLTRAGA